VRKIEFGLKEARNYFWYRARINLTTALAINEKKYNLYVFSNTTRNLPMVQECISPSRLKMYAGTKAVKSTILVTYVYCP